MTTPIEQAYAQYMVGEMIIEEVQKSVGGQIPTDHHTSLEIEDQGEAHREEAAWQAATEAAQTRNDLVLKSKILSHYAEDDPDSVVSALIASICADIDRLLDGKTQPAPNAVDHQAFDDLEMIGHGHAS